MLSSRIGCSGAGNRSGEALVEKGPALAAEVVSNCGEGGRSYSKPSETTGSYHCASDARSSSLGMSDCSSRLLFGLHLDAAEIVLCGGDETSPVRWSEGSTRLGFMSAARGCLFRREHFGTTRKPARSALPGGHATAPDSPASRGEAPQSQKPKHMNVTTVRHSDEW